MIKVELADVRVSGDKLNRPVKCKPQIVRRRNPSHAKLVFSPVAAARFYGVLMDTMYRPCKFIYCLRV